MKPKVLVYTGFPSYAHLKACFDFLDPIATHLQYREQERKATQIIIFGWVFSYHGTFVTWLAWAGYCIPFQHIAVNCLHNLYYMDQFHVPAVQKDPTLATTKDTLDLTCLRFLERYPTTRVIIDATEVFIQQPVLPELQQLTFLLYKNDNIYKGIGTSSSGAVMFVSWQYIR